MKIETPVLKRLGPVPFWRGSDKCLDSLETVYRRAMEKASRLLASSERVRTSGADAASNSSSSPSSAETC